MKNLISAILHFMMAFYGSFQFVKTIKQQEYGWTLVMLLASTLLFYWGLKDINLYFKEK